MRRAVLFRSINRALGTSEQVLEAAYLWTRHRLMLWYGAAAFMLVFAVAEYAGFDDLATKVALGAAGVAVAVTATTEYRIVAMTTEDTYMFTASRIRRVARTLIGKLESTAPMSPPRLVGAGLEPRGRVPARVVERVARGVPGRNRTGRKVGEHRHDGSL